MQAPTPYLAMDRPWKTWSLVSALIAAATACGLLLDRHISLSSHAMFYVLAVVLGSYALRPLPSAVCAVVAVVAFNFFFVPPRWAFAVGRKEHLIALLTMLVLALTISRLSAGLRRETELARRNAQRAHQLQELASALAGATHAPAVAELGQQALDSTFSGPTTLGVLRPDGSLDCGLALADRVEDGMRSCMHEAATLGPGTGRWPGLNAWYIPLGGTGAMQGAVCIENITAADVDGREHAQALCTLLAQALARITLQQAMRASEAEVQRQQIQSTFLAAISHDLRTPLATVVGAASALQSQGDKLPGTERERLLESIVSEAAYLSDVTENTLQLMQLSNTTQALHRGWESMEEIVGAVLGRMRLRDTHHRIRVSVPPNLPLIEADPVLLAQLISNLIDNALKYSQGAIDLQVQATAQQMQVSVKDRGNAIPADMYAVIFQPYARGDRSGARGAGLGLALCRAIAQAHGGTLDVQARRSGGNRFVFCLPLGNPPPLGELP